MVRLLLLLPVVAVAGQWPEWSPVTSQDMTERVEVRYTDSYGAVGPREMFPKRSEGCPIIDRGSVVGWSLGCKFSTPRDASHGVTGLSLTHF